MPDMSPVTEQVTIPDIVEQVAIPDIGEDVVIPGNIKPETLAERGKPDLQKRYDVDWAAVQKKFIETNATMRDLGAEIGVPYTTIRTRAWREHWSDKRHAWRVANLGGDHTHIFEKTSTKLKLAAFEAKDEKENKKILDDTHSIAIQKLAMLMREASSATELTKLIKALIELRESDTLTNVERTQLTIDIPEEYSE